MVKKRVLVSVVAMGVLAAVVVRGQQRSSPSLVGVWKIVEVTTPGPEGRKLTNLQPSLHMFTPRYFSVTEVRSESARPEIPDPDNQADKQLADSVRPFAARAGTYEVKGNEIIYHPIVGMLQNVMKPGFVFIDTFKLEGNGMLVIVPKSGVTGPVANPPTFKLTRLEVAAGLTRVVTT